MIWDARRKVLRILGAERLAFCDRLSFTANSCVWIDGSALNKDPIAAGLTALATLTETIARELATKREALKILQKENENA